MIGTTRSEIIDHPPGMKRAWVLMLIGLAIAFGVPELDLVGRIDHGAPGMSITREAVWWGIALVLLLYARFVEHRPLASIGLRRPTIKTFTIGVAAALLLFAIVIVVYALLFPLFGLSMNQQATEGITHHPLWFQIALALRGAVVEEILYRGYPIARIAEVTGSKWFAAAISIVAFTAAHLRYWGGAQLLIVAPAALVFALMFLWRRDLVSNMVAHFLVDVAGFVAATFQS
jgi:membrane protease YdiL (CAAX protease family)